MGIFEAAVASGAGIFAYKRIQKSRNEKKRQVQDEHPNQAQQQQQQQQSYESNRDASNHNLSDKPRDINRNSSTRTCSPDYFSRNTAHANGNGYGYQYQPQPLTFQPASEKFRGQRLRIDTENISVNYYPTHQARQELYYLDTCVTNPAVSGSSLYHYSKPQRTTQHQSSFVEELHDPVCASEHERAQCYYI